MYEDSDNIIFSSEFQSFFDFGIKIEINEIVLNNYFGFACTLAPDTIANNVENLLLAIYFIWFGAWWFINIGGPRMFKISKNELLLPPTL